MQTALTSFVKPPPIPAYLSLIEKMTEYSGPSAFIKQVMSRIPSQTNGNTRGKIFEMAFCEVLKQEEITPFSYQVRMAFRPIIDFDVLLMQSNNRPMSFSLKTSLRERWKQSYLEAVLLRMSYPLSTSYLLTMNSAEAKPVQRLIRNGEMPEMQSCIIASEGEFDDLINDLQNRKFNPIDNITPFRGRQVL